jgi:multimeric flavodoxin WrbA
MHAVIMSGSNDREGQTARCANAVARGISKAGGTFELIFLPTLKIERCRQCNPDGWGICRTEARCIIEDDFAELVKKLQAADLVVFASPVYFKELSESLRGFLDRLRRISYEQPEPPLKGKPAFGVCCAGGGGGGAPSACFILEGVLDWIGFRIIDSIPVKRQNLESRLPVLERAGERLASGSDLGPSAYSIRLANATRWLYKLLVYLAYYRLGRWRRKGI